MCFGANGRHGARFHPSKSQEANRLAGVMSQRNLVPVLALVLAGVGGGWVAATLLPHGMARLYLEVTGVQADTFYGPVPRVATFTFGGVITALFMLWLLTSAGRVLSRWETMTPGDKVTVFVGVLVGVAVSIPFHMLFFAFGSVYLSLSFLIMFLLIGISTAMLRGMQEVLPWNSRTGTRGDIKIFDTNVIIDGRIGDVVRAGFLDGRIYIPQFVIAELQLVADSPDPNKRQRGRRGLDMLKILRADREVEVGTYDHYAPQTGPVDERLVALARTLGARLVTNDFNLNKVAQVHGVEVLNVNDLALALRPVFLPGDALDVVVERPGSQPGQGVGFLEDGTMVVIEQAAELIGTPVRARVSQIHQSAAGRMIFATLEEVLVGENNQ